MSTCKLNTPLPPHHPPIRTLNQQDKLELKEHKDSGVYVKGLNAFVVKSVPEIKNVLEVCMHVRMCMRVRAGATMIMCLQQHVPVGEIHCSRQSAAADVFFLHVAMHKILSTCAQTRCATVLCLYACCCLCVCG